MTDNTIQNRIDTLFTQSGADQVFNAVEKLEKKTVSASKGAKQAADAFSEWEKRTRQLGRALALDKIQSDLVKAAKSGKDMGDAFERANQELRKLNATASETKSVVGGAAETAATSAGGLGGRISALGRAGRVGLPSIPIAGTSTDQLARVVQAVGLLGPALLPVSVGIVALTTAVIGLKLAGAEAEKVINAAIVANEEYFKAIQDGTEDSIRAQIEGLKTDRQVKASIIDTNKAFFTAMEKQVGTVGRAFFDIFNIGGTASLRASTQEAEAALFQLDATIQSLENAADSSEVAVNTLNQALEDYASRTIDAQISALSLSADGIQSRIEALGKENEAITRFIQSGRATGELLDELTEKQQKNAIDLNELFNALPGAQARQRVEDAKKALEAIGTGAVKIQEQTQAKIERIIETGAKQIESAEKRLSDARVKLVDFDKDRADKRAELESKARADNLKAVEEFGKQERKIQRDNQTKLLDMIEDHNQNLLDVEIENSTAQFLEEERRFGVESKRARRDLSTAEQDRLDALMVEKEQIREGLIERLSALDKESEKKRADLQAEIEERAIALETVKQNINDQVEAEKAAQDEALRHLVESFDPTVNHMIQAVQNGFAIMEQSGIAATGAIASILDELQRRAKVNYLSTGTTSSLSAENNFLRRAATQRGGRTITAFQHGGVAPSNKIVRINDGGGMESGLDRRGQLAVFANPTRVFSATDTARLLSRAGGTTINFSMSNVNLGAMTEETFKAEMTGILTEVMQGMVGARQGRLAS